MADESWRFYIRDTAVVSEFPDAVPTDHDGIDRLRDRWIDLLDEDGIDSHVVVLEVDGTPVADVFELLRVAATVGTDHDVGKLAVVADDVSTREVDRELPVDDVDVSVSENRRQALQWIKH